MKKLLLAVPLLLLAACHPLQKIDLEPTHPGYLLTSYIVNQHLVAMDPFSVAERFNVLMTECNWDLPSADPAVKSGLFGNTVINDLGNGVYQLVFSGSVASGDDMRQGNIVLSTGGVSMSIPGTVWTVRTVSESGYILSWGSSLINIFPGTYSIRCSDNNEWTIEVNNLVSSIQGQTAVSEDMSWKSVTVIQQISGDQSYASYKDATYQMTLSVERAMTMYYIDDVSASTSVPLKYNPRVCGKKIVGDGQMTCWVTDYLDTSRASATWLGTSFTDCNPKIRIVYQGYQKDW